MEQQGISKLDLKRRNRMQVLNIIKQNGPTSRIDIANTLQLTRAAVTIITTDMIDEGIIHELGEYKQPGEKAARGRKKILLDINYNYKFIIGVSVEENIVSVGISTLSGDVLDKRNMPIDEGFDRHQIFAFIEKSINEVLTDNCLENDDVLGIGFGIYHQMCPRLGIEIIDDNPSYDKIKTYFEERTGLPTAFDSSPKGCAIANLDFGKDIDHSIKNIAFLRYGNSIDFMSTYLNEPLETYQNRTDFINKMIIDPDANDVCTCGRCGCVENELVVKSIVRDVIKEFSESSTPFLYAQTNGDASQVTPQLVVRAYQSGDKAVIKIIHRGLKLLSVLINNLDLFSDPDKIVIHLECNDTYTFWDDFKNEVEKISGKEVTDKLVKSSVDYKHRFLAGCAIAERVLFFNRGGFKPNI